MIRSSAITALLIFVAMFVWSHWPAQAQGLGMDGGETRVSTPWRPNKQDAKYSGPQACAKCHQQESANIKTTAMGRALEPVATSEILRANPRLTFRSGQYAHEIIRRGDQSFYSVTDGTNTISEPILYTFGQGK